MKPARKTIREQRVAELAGFIELLTERFKANESVFADRLELSERELACLRALAREGAMITRELGGRFGVPVSTMTGLIDRMETKGLVRRIRGRLDRRAIELEATPAGTLALREHARGMEAIARGMLETLNDRDQRWLIEILRRVRDGFATADRRATAS
jgi:DNA-binding MarR family transcriptional regulator